MGIILSLLLINTLYLHSHILGDPQSAIVKSVNILLPLAFLSLFVVYYFLYYSGFSLFLAGILGIIGIFLFLGIDLLFEPKKLIDYQLVRGLLMIPRIIFIGSVGIFFLQRSYLWQFEIQLISTLIISLVTIYVVKITFTRLGEILSEIQSI